MTKIDRKEIEKTQSLECAVREAFGLEMEGRTHILSKEAMSGDVAKQYNNLGISGRQDTYRRIVQDFKNRTGCYGVNHPKNNMQVGTILEVGCGSGLLSLELAEQTNGQIIGIDLSEDMLQLADKNLKARSEEKKRQTIEFWKKLPWYCKVDREALETNPPLLDSVEFRQVNVYDLPQLVEDKQKINYMVCRNALHRFEYPELAIHQMYSVLSQNGKLYIRDLRRDADWKIILNRIGEKRWKNPALVEDYMGAMAAMLTTNELEANLRALGISQYNIGDGRYDIHNDDACVSGQINEFSTDVEYVCVIQKQ